MKLLKNKYIQATLVVLAYAAISYMYLYPAGQLMLEGNSEFVMSDGTDPTAAPNSYAQLDYTLHHEPLNLFFGALPSKTYSAPEGMALWFFWYEKITSVFAAQLVPIEQVTTMIVWISYILNALAFYFLGNILGWKKPISFAGGLAWAICAYTRGRAKVHMALSATYFLPTIFIGLFLLKRNKSKKDVALASLAFFLTALAAQYYIILLASIFPVLLFYYFSDSNLVSLKKKTLNLIIAAIPALSLLTWTIVVPVPSGVLSATRLYPRTGEVPTNTIHPFLNTYAARVIDYFSGDVAIGVKDVNPIRYLINRYVVEHMDGSNYHERANGIRWTVLTLFVLALFNFFRKRNFTISNSSMYAFLGLAVLSFLISLGPTWFGLNIGPAIFVNKVIAQFRVTSRASIFVYFSILVVACYYVSSLKSKKWLWLFPLLIFIEMPPFINPMPIAQIKPVYKSLERYKTDNICGLGMYFPYVSGQWQLLQYYTFLQRLRGVRCPSINATNYNDREVSMINYFPLNQRYMDLIISNSAFPKQQLQNFARCASLSWIAFDGNVPMRWREEQCQSLGWIMTDPEICQAPQHLKYPSRLNENCIGAKL